LELLEVVGAAHWMRSMSLALSKLRLMRLGLGQASCDDALKIQQQASVVGIGASEFLNYST